MKCNARFALPTLTRRDYLSTDAIEVLRILHVHRSRATTFPALGRRKVGEGERAGRSRRTDAWATLCHITLYCIVLIMLWLPSLNRLIAHTYPHICILSVTILRAYHHSSDAPFINPRTLNMARIYPDRLYKRHRS